MRLLFTVVLAISCCLMCFTLVYLRSNTSRLSVSLQKLLLLASGAIISNFLIGISRDPLGVEVGNTAYFIFLDWICYALLVFSSQYTGRDNFYSGWMKFGQMAYIVDSVQLFLNLFIHHAFVLTDTTYKGDSYFIIKATPYYLVHLIADYISIALALLLLIVAACKTVSFYRIRFIAILFPLIGIILLNLLIMMNQSPLDWSVLLYAATGIFISYLTFEYIPARLRTQSLKTSLDAMSEGLILFDRDDNQIYANRIVYSILKGTNNPAEAVKALIRQHNGTERIREIPEGSQIGELTSGSNTYNYRRQIKHIYDNADEYLGSLLVIQNITEERVAMQVMQHAKEEALNAKEAALNAQQIADRANKAKSEFLANMSHEIRTPINSILGMDEMILREDVSEEVRQYADNIRIAGNTLLSLINDVLDFSKIEAGRMELVLDSYSPMTIVRQSTLMAQTRASAKDLDFFVKFNPNIPQQLYGDCTRIQQVMTNILTNGIKYTIKGNVTLDVDFEMREATWGVLKIQVSDTGIGISPEDQTKMFDAFQRVDVHANRNIEGTGLGLAITRQLVSMMKGRMSLQSTKGIGSTFLIEIPQAILNADPSGEFTLHDATLQQTYEESFKAPNAHILVVDDVAMNLAVVRGLLKPTGVQLTCASNGAEAVGLFRENEYDLVFLDHMMPGMDGIETLHMMREIEGDTRHTPIVILTANAIAGASASYLAEGFDDYLSKPVRGVDLEGSLLKYLPEELIVKED